MKMISILTPCFNEELNVADCYEGVRKLFHTKLSEYEYEHVFCDNASTDATVAILRDLAAADPRVKVIVNARNYGPFRSAYNGLTRTSGDAALVFLAADMQDPVEMLVEFVANWERGYKVIYGVREKREESRVMELVRRAYYRLVRRMANVYIPPNVGEFQLIDRAVVDALKKCDDYYPYIRGMIANCGFKSTGINYTWVRRGKGVSKNRLYDLFDQAMNGLISFSNVPLRLCMLCGFGLSVLSILYAFVQLIINITQLGQVQPGIPTLIVAIFFFSGVQLFFLGLLGEYISAIHFQVRKRPLVVEEELINF